MGFSIKTYQQGVLEIFCEEEHDLFYSVFSKWKSITVMEPDIKAKAIKRIKGLLEKRTEGIMNANRRNYYGECAAYIAALRALQGILVHRSIIISQFCLPIFLIVLLPKPQRSSLRLRL